MAIQGTLVTPYSGVTHLIEAIPLGDLIESPFMITTPPDTVSEVVAQRFPVPASALGFLIDNSLIAPDFPLGDDIGLDPPHLLPWAVVPESRLEPTTGQIWPR